MVMMTGRQDDCQIFKLQGLMAGVVAQLLCFELACVAKKVRNRRADHLNLF